MKRLNYVLFAATLLLWSCGEGGDEPNPGGPTIDEVAGCTDPLASNFNSEANADDCNCDYDGFTAIGAPPAQAEKNILIEDFTGEWCGWCVDATVIIDEIVNNHPGRVYVNAVHQGDFLQNGAANVVLIDFIPSFYPSGLVDRNTSEPISRDLWAGQASIRLGTVAQAGIAIETQMVSLTQMEGVVHVDFKADLSSKEYVLHLYLTESGIPAAAQQNYYSGLNGAQDHPYYNKAGVLGPTGYTHNDALREIIASIPIADKAVRNEGVFTRKFQLNLSSYIGSDVQILAFITTTARTKVANVIGVEPGETIDW